MSHFWQFAKLMLERRAMLVGAVVFAVMSAIGLGAGLMSLAPALNMILAPQDGASLHEMAVAYNAADNTFAGIAVAVPQFVVELLPTGQFAGVRLLVLVVLLLSVFGCFCNFLHQFLSQKLATLTTAQIRQTVFDRVVHMPLGRVVERGPSQLVARIVRDSVEIQRGFIAMTSRMVAQITKGLAAFGVALYFNWALTATTIVIAPIIAIVLRKFGKRIRRGTYGVLASQEGLLRVASENLQGIRAVKASTAEKQASERFAAINATAIEQEIHVVTARSISSPAVELLAITVLCLLALPAANLILTERLSFQGFILTMGALGIAGASFRPLTSLFNEVHAAAAPAQRLAELLAEPIESENSAAMGDLPRHHQSIEFDAVNLTYPGAEHPALIDVTAKLRHGERVAVVGPNGSGKTTLISLVPRLLVPNGGRVLIDGIDVQSVNLRSLRKQIGVVTQETVLFRGSIAENLAFGIEHASRIDLIAAAKQAHAHEFIERIPGGYDADLAEQGASLSGGQRQRLAIARAIMRDPSILILDEATSQIDAESEHMINEALLEFCAGRTTLIVAHRLSTVVNADRIIVMDRGGIVDVGTHTELMQRSDLYARLAKTQLIVPSS